MRRALVVALLALLSLAPRAAALDVAIAPYLEALRVGAVGAVEGRALEERRRPQGADKPLTGTSVLLVPRSADLLETLEAIRARSRGSVAAFVEAAPAILQAKNAYELALWEAGAADLARATSGDREGRFRFAEVPEGAWLLLVASRSSDHTLSKNNLSRPFVMAPRVSAFHDVAIWVRELNVTRADTLAVELTDRNVWFNGVVEVKTLDTGPLGPGPSGRWR